MKRVLPISLAAAMLWIDASSAHHSHAQYDMTLYRELSGTVIEYHWISPHVWVYLEVEGDSDGPGVWALESTAPTILERRGIPRNLLSVGDRVDVRCHPLHDGSNGCLLGNMTTPDGVERLWD